MYDEKTANMKESAGAKNVRASWIEPVFDAARTSLGYLLKYLILMKL